jgi:hypothetical protein
MQDVIIFNKNARLKISVQVEQQVGGNRVVNSSAVCVEII